MPTLTFYLKLVGTNPLVTRTFKVSSDITMYELHHSIQVVMGWQNYHLYQFTIGDQKFEDHRLLDGETHHVTDVKAATVGEVFTEVGRTARYEYDFGDGWVHHLELIDKTTQTPVEVLPRVLVGEHACPPEDCGGIPGYQDLLAILSNPKHPEYREFKVWAGRNFNPTAFSVDACNAELKKLPKYIKEYEQGFRQ
jgi:hypothetical protein